MCYEKRTTTLASDTRGFPAGISGSAVRFHTRRASCAPSMGRTTCAGHLGGGCRILQNVAGLAGINWDKAGLAGINWD